MSITYILINIVPMFAIPLLTLGYIPQLIKTFRTKDVSGISKAFWVMLSGALFCVLVAQVTSFVVYGTWGLMLKEIINFIPAFAMMIMVFMYSKNTHSEDVTNTTTVDLKAIVESPKTVIQLDNSTIEFHEGVVTIESNGEIRVAYTEQ
mgnify:FL=1